MKTLYISDLEGTLLNQNAEVSRYTVEVLNRMIRDGMYFSVATARTSATAVKMLDEININTPIILMNGVCVYDTSTHRCIKTESIPANAKQDMLSTLENHRISGFLYSIDQNQLNSYYENTDSPNAKEFIKEREERFGKCFTRVNRFTDCLNKNLVYYSVSDTHEKLAQIYEELTKTKGLHIEFYRDIYHTDYWYLEICSANASKYNAVHYLRKHFEFDKVIGFGDNLNDLLLFEACDESYAVENANPAVKEKANTVIAGNRDDGVAKYLLRINQNS